MTAGNPIDARVGAVVGGVLRQLLADTRATAILVRDDGADAATLVRGWIVRELGAHALADAPGDGVIVADPVSKTALLLDATWRDAAVLPVGDLYASQIERLTGRWSAPPAVAALAERAGGIGALDGALADWIERRRSLDEALAGLPADVRAAVADAADAARYARRRAPLVPKLAWRTVGVDLFA